MNIQERIDSAKNYLDRARRELDSGYGFNMVPCSLSGALAIAMEAWLLSHGHEIDYCHRLNDYMTFTGQAPAELASGFRHCWAGASTLEFFLYGDSSTSIKLPTLEEWKVRADICIIECEGIVAAIIHDIHGSESSATRARSCKERQL